MKLEELIVRSDFQGSITYSVMIALGEMVAHLPIAGGHISLGQRFVDPAFSFMLGCEPLFVLKIKTPKLTCFRAQGITGITGPSFCPLS